MVGKIEVSGEPLVLVPIGCNQSDDRPKDQGRDSNPRGSPLAFFRRYKLVWFSILPKSTPVGYGYFPTNPENSPRLSSELPLNHPEVSLMEQRDRNGT